MIKTTSLELSKRLYELAPEWNDTHFKYYEWEDHIEVSDGAGISNYEGIPAPDLEWLLDKLPQNVGRITMKHREHSGVWFCKWDNRKIEFCGQADTACDAACKLLINLIEQQVIIPNGDK